MAVIDKIRKYLDTHATPVDSSTLAHRFLVSQGTIADALKRLEDEGFAERKKHRNRFLWSKVERPDRSTRFVALPKDFRPIRTTPQSPHIRTSYPNIRGYDD